MLLIAILEILGGGIVELAPTALGAPLGASGAFEVFGIPVEI